MKKISALLLALSLCVGMLAGCGSKEEPAPAPTPDAPEATETADGSVYYLNFKPEFDEALKGLAADYTAETGVEVKVVTAASGTYSDTLTAEMAKSEAPTIFNIGNMSGLKDWDEYALNLADTAVAKELNTDGFNLYNEAGELKAMGH